MSDNWGYVVAGYALTTGTLVAYATWIKLRTRRLKRLLSDEGRD
jgi:hypothetical protein